MAMGRARAREPVGVILLGARRLQWFRSYHFCVYLEPVGDKKSRLFLEVSDTAFCTSFLLMCYVHNFMYTTHKM